jgi:hypothetical protein
VLPAAVVPLVLLPALRWEGGKLLLQQRCRCQLLQAVVCCWMTRGLYGWKERCYLAAAGLLLLLCCLLLLLLQRN